MIRCLVSQPSCCFPIHNRIVTDSSSGENIGSMSSIRPPIGGETLHWDRIVGLNFWTSEANGSNSNSAPFCISTLSLLWLVSSFTAAAPGVSLETSGFDLCFFRELRSSSALSRFLFFKVAVSPPCSSFVGIATWELTKIVQWNYFILRLSTIVECPLRAHTPLLPDEEILGDPQKKIEWGPVLIVDKG